MSGINLLRNTLLVLIASLFGAINAPLADDCQMQISHPIIDYGSLNPDLLRAAAKTSTSASLEKRHILLNVWCPEPRDMAISFHGAASGLEAYKFGDNGSFELTIRSAQLDGTPVLLGAISSINEIPAGASGSVKLTPGHYIVPVTDQHSRVGKVYSMNIEIASSLLTEHLKIRDLATLEGKGHFELK